jgi:hypothetical protein
MFFGNAIPTGDKMVGWKSNANFFPCQEKVSGMVVTSKQNLLQCGTGKKEDIPARLTQLTAGGLDVGQLGEDQIITSLDAAVEYVASIMMKVSTLGGRQPSTYKGVSKTFSHKKAGGTKLAAENGERWKGYTRCDGGFWERLGTDDYDDKGVVSWGVTDEVVFSNTAVPGGGQIIVSDAPADELMYGGTICGTTARKTKCFQVRSSDSTASRRIVRVGEGGIDR